MKFITLFICCVLISGFYTQETCDIPAGIRSDCGFVGMTQNDCTSKGCCWQPVNFPQQMRLLLQGKITPEQVQNGDTPWCYYKGDPEACVKFNLKSSTAGFENTYDGLYKAFMDNINIDGRGGVVASPDPDTPGGSYYYHWMRDAALTMRTFMELNDNNYDKVRSNMNSYLSWVQNVQSETDPNGISILIEPKFYLPYGQPYTGGWCRPQTDGPGIRSGTLIQYANIILKNGDSVKSNLQNAIQTDLDWVADNWGQNGCDLWEEIESTDFFWNRMSFYQSLTWGSQLFQTLGNSGLAQKYQNAAQQIKPTLYEHYNGQFIYESTNREKDSAVIHALIEFNDDIFEIDGKEVAQTVSTFNTLFCSEYKINQDQDQQKIPGILYGRYEGDQYAGGNPWQLLTAALATLHYQLAEKYQNSNGTLNSEIYNNWKDILDLQDGASEQDFAKANYQAGNSVMFRMWGHVESDVYQLAEQMDRATGEQLSAKSLTWSFANVLKNLHFYVNNESLSQKYNN